MKRITLALLLFISASCAKEKPDYAILGGLESSILYQSSADYQGHYEVIINHSIRIDNARKIVNKTFPGKRIIDIVPIKYDNDTVLFSVAFDNGWAIVAADDRVDDPVVAFDNEGSFDPSDIQSPEVAFWYESMLKGIKRQMDIKDVRTVKCRQKKTKGINDYEPYYWLGFRIATDYYATSGQVNHLMDTQWGQDSHWAEKAPYGPINEYPYMGYYPTGCLAVATGQILYYLKTHKGFSIGLYHTVSPTYTLVADSTYVISNIVLGDFTEPSVRWSLMAKNLNESNTSYVADLMIDIGYRFGFVYTPYGSGTVYIAPIFDTFNVDCESGLYYFSLVKENLDNGFPVFINAYSQPGYIGGHAWVIDGYYLAKHTTDMSYRWQIVASDSLNYYSGYEFCYTEAQKQIYAPDASEENIYHIYETYGGNYLRMNWGWNGLYDSGYYSMNDYYWPENAFGYTYNPQIAYSYSQENE